jgi:hypothetical protein
MDEEGMGTFPRICFVLNNYEKGLIYLFFYVKKKEKNHSLFNGSKVFLG